MKAFQAKNKSTIHNTLDFELFFINFAYDLVSKVVSIANVLFWLNKQLILCNIKRHASIATPSGLNGDNPFAISSAFTNSLQLSISGNIVNEAVVFPAPLHPLIMYNTRFIQYKDK